MPEPIIVAGGAVTAIVGAAQHRYALGAVALFALAVGALGAYLFSRRQDAATDRAIPERLLSNPAHDTEALPAELGVRTAVVQLSMQRLVRSGQISRSSTHL